VIARLRVAAFLPVLALALPAAAARSLTPELQADALYEEALGLLSEGRAGDAASILREAVTVSPGHWRSHCALGRIHAESRQLDAAVASLEAAVAIQPDAACMALLAQALLVGEKLDRAEVVLRRAAALEGAGESVLYNFARLLDRSERFEEAVDVWVRYIAVATDPARAASARLRAARLLALLGRPLDAVPYYRALLAGDPARQDVRSELATALMRASRHDEAWAEYEILMASGAADAAALSSAGSICQLRRDLKCAVDLLGRSVAMDRSSIPTRVALAMAQAQSGDDEAAIGTLQAIVADDPENVKAWFLMGQSLRKLGRVEEARRAMERHERIHEKIMREKMTPHPP